jgi:hypothetical protein
MVGKFSYTNYKEGANVDIQTDNLFLIGKSHKVCQDYTLAGVQDGIHFAIVCDGCSSSKDTDIGARILAITARRFLSFMELGREAFGRTVIQYADMTRQNLGLDISCLDATLMVTAVHGSKCYSYCYGDGYIIEDFGDSVFLAEHSFPSGAPYYLSYWLNKDREKAYKQQFGDGGLTIKLWKDGDLIANHDYNYNWPLDIAHKVAPGAIILTSDGLDTFHGAQGPYLKAVDVYRAFIAFKGTAGEFLKRRAVKHCELLEKEHKVFHQDDLGMSCILFKENV